MATSSSVVQVRQNGTFSQLQVPDDDGSTDLRVRLKRAVRSNMSLPRSVHKFRLIAEYLCEDDTDVITSIHVYGFTAGACRPNTHELPPSSAWEGADAKLLFGPILVARVCVETGRLATLTVDAYRSFLDGMFAEESIGSTDSERSTDGSDNGSDLVGFIVSDSVCD